MRVPSKDYSRQYSALMPELLARLEEVLLGENPVLGRSVEEFEQAFAEYLGVEHVVSVGTGTDALILSLRVLGIGPGDEVVTAGNTFMATVTAIVASGARPVLVDPDPDTMNLTAEGVRSALTSRIAAVLPVHLYGRMCPMAEIASRCAERNVPVIEDAAQAHGARSTEGRRAGAWGRAGCFSFHPSKNLGAFGDGGAIALPDSELVEELRALRNLGKVSKFEIHHVAPNTKLDTLQAAILRLKLPHLDAWNARRAEIARRYRDRLAGIDGLRLPPDAPEGSHVHHLFVVRTGERDRLREELLAQGIKAGIHYPVPPHLQELGVDLGYGPGDLPVTEELAATVLSLPCAPELSDDEIDLVCERVRAFHGE